MVIFMGADVRRVIEAVEIIYEDHEKATSKGLTFATGHFVDVDPGGAVGELCHQPLIEEWGHLASAFSAADMYAIPDIVFYCILLCIILCSAIVEEDDNRALALRRLDLFTDEL